MDTTPTVPPIDRLTCLHPVGGVCVYCASKYASPTVPSEGDVRRLACPISYPHMPHDHCNGQPQWDRVMDVLNAKESQLAAANARIGEAEKIIQDRGVFERDCMAPLAQRIDNLIVEQRSAQYWKAMFEMAAKPGGLAQSFVELQAELAALQKRLAEREACLNQTSIKSLCALEKKVAELERRNAELEEGLR